MTAYLDNLYKTKECKNWIFILFLIPLVGFSLAGCTPVATPYKNLNPTQTESPTIQNINGDLEVLITEFEKTMPRAKTEGFIIPTKSEELAFHNMVLAIEDNNPELAIQPTFTYNYEIIKFSDQGNFGAESYILREQLPITQGWGTYIFSIRSSQNIIIEAPHPLADKQTPEVALDIFRALNARALLISGAHRDANRDGSADSTHAPESIFQTVHIALFESTQQSNNSAIFLQIHGFAAHDHPHYPQIVIGHNWKDDPEKDLLLQKIANAMKNNDIKVGICDGKNYQDLCGRLNLQGSVMDGGIFIHMELNESLRRDDSALINSLKQAISPYIP